MKKSSLFAAILSLLWAMGCNTGEDKRDGTSDRPQPSVGSTVGDPPINTTGTAPPGDTAGVNAREGVNDQTGPTGRGHDTDHRDAPAY